ncbi:MAG: magnesium transporter [Clostridia bacterium]|nr:magnesium transporter [Clostridia bacterium]MBQ7090950.1 magnesium transporter [Clostridia bacterium]
MIEMLDSKDYEGLRRKLLQLKEHENQSSKRSYMCNSPLVIFKRRIPWLMMLMVSAIFTARILAVFENALATHTVFVLFIPMLMGAGGNAGIQASVAVIRGISLNELHFKDFGKVLWKEVQVAFLCGLVLVLVNLIKIVLIDNLLFHTAISIVVMCIVSLTLLFTVVLSKIVGCLLPLISVRLGFDPAVMASPFVTTIVDIASLLLYFGIIACFDGKI